MVVNEFESSNAYRLQQILSTLKNVHGYTLDLNSQDVNNIRALGENSEIVKNSIVKESAFNTWMQNPEYTKNILIMEAVKLYLTEIAPRRMSNKVKKVKEGVSPIQPTAPGANNGANNAQQKTPAGKVTIQKGTDTKTIDATQLANMQKQGYSIVGDPAIKEEKETLADLMARYGVTKKPSKNITEAAHMDHDDYQASMARSELYRNTKYAMDLMKIISADDEVKPWVAANLTKAAKTLDEIYHYMDYYTTFEPDAEKEDTTVVEDVNDTSTGAIARQNLMMIMEYSTKLFRMIEPGDKLEGWMAMKLTNASEAISSSKHYMDYAQFEKYVGHDLIDIDTPVKSTVDETKKKKAVKEGRMVTVGNIIMNAMLNEEQDLAQAQTLLAAKAMSEDLQGIAEKLAKMGVEDLMPIVDVMKEQFGQDMANGFNETIKAAIEAVLNAATSAKDTTDNAIISLQNGQVPGAEVSADTEDFGDLGDTSLDSGSEVPEKDEFDTTPPAAGAAEEPIGRAKKKSKESPEEIEETWEMKTAEKDKGKWDGYTIAELEAKKKKLMAKKERTADEQKTVKQLNFAIRAKHRGAGKWGKVEEAKKAKPDFLDVDKDGNTTEPMKKAFKDKKKKEVKESAPPGKKAEDFIKASKKDFKERYGKDWESKLYATAWKKFGPKSENIIKNAKMLEAANAKKAKLISTFEAHKRQHKKMVSEGTIKDPLNTGYGLDGQLILDQIDNVNGVISRLKEMMRAEMQQGVRNLITSVKNNKKAEVLETTKARTPYGVVWTENGKQQNKFFETAKLRQYWMDLNKNTLTESKLINPEDFDQRINKLTRKG